MDVGALRLGLHVSIEGELDQAVDRALERGCNTMQMFTRNPRGWQFKALDPSVIECFGTKLAGSGIEPVFSHMPYLSNLASPKEAVYSLSVKALKAELKRCIQLRIPYAVTHMGSDLGLGKVAGLKRIVVAINSALEESPGETVVLLENTAGTKNSMGSSFEDVRRVLDAIAQSERVGVCLDTCHAFAAGYDLVTPTAIERTLGRFKDVIGLNRLKVIHLNDSVGGLGSHLDRHEHIGLGKIGEDGFRNILRSPLRRLPLILETPIDQRRSDVGNLQKVRELASSTAIRM